MLHFFFTTSYIGSINHYFETAKIHFYYTVGIRQSDDFSDCQWYRDLLSFFFFLFQPPTGRWTAFTFLFLLKFEEKLSRKAGVWLSVAIGCCEEDKETLRRYIGNISAMV